MSTPDRQAARDPFAKDCGCVHHEAPHWLYMAAFAKRARLRLIERLRTATGDQAHALAAYIARKGVNDCRELLSEMRRRGVESIPEEMWDLARQDLEEGGRRIWNRRRKEGRAKLPRLQRKLDQAVEAWPMASDAQRHRLQEQVAELQRLIARAKEGLDEP